MLGRFLFPLLIAWPVLTLAAPPALLDDQFQLPPGFHIYRAAAANLCGGSYEIALDEMGRLLVADGQAIRRLRDDNRDGLYDSHEIIATGLGSRGPQGLLVDGDNLYAVGGDGVQLFTGYRTHDKLLPQGRIGQPFRTGGDHEAHTLLRGHDGWIYLVSGDGGGIEDRKHITEPHSAAMFERAASVFRFDPSGQRWECVSTGGRNPPSLGMNEIGEMFSLDSDMEWHVDVPWYRPVRLNVWLTGGDNGWQQVGAFPPYYLDNVPGILDVGRGSPNWGLFYEHRQFPERYHNAFLVADYRWKSATQGDYNSSGRLLAFHLRRDSAWWKAEMTELAKAKAEAKDAAGQPIGFAVVDLEVAPDGSLLISDHNQGVWRLFYDLRPSGSLSASPVEMEQTDLPGQREALLKTLLTHPQPSAAWSRVVIEEQAKAVAEFDLAEAYREAALDATRPLAERLRAVRFAAVEFEKLPEHFLEKLAATETVELRGQAAWLLGLRRSADEAALLGQLLQDADPFVRRRAAEAANRHPAASLTPILLAKLDDPERVVRYCAMTALAHRPVEEWRQSALASDDSQVLARALTAAHLRREAIDPNWLASAMAKLLAHKTEAVEDVLDLLRVLSLSRSAMPEDLAEQVRAKLLADFPGKDRNLRWEQARLIGEFQVSAAFGKLLAELLAEKDGLTQFHFAQALAKLPDGWDAASQGQLVEWLLLTQQSWFAELAGKGLEFPHFWATILAGFAEHHGEALAAAKAQLQPASLLAEATYPVLLKQAEGDAVLRSHFAAAKDWPSQKRLLSFLAQARKPEVAAFLIAELGQIADQAQRDEYWKALALMPLEPPQLPVLAKGLVEAKDKETLGRLLSRFTKESKPLEAWGTLPDLRWRSASGPEALAGKVVGILAEPTLASAANRTLQKLAGEKPGQATSKEDRAQLANFWAGWFGKRFGHPLPQETSLEARSDEATHALVIAALRAPGEAAKGAGIFLKAGCFACHGGLPDQQTVIFGPDLAGGTTRLSASELADALVFPSKQVAERFKAAVIELTSGETHTGFVTEQSADFVILTDNAQVRKLARQDIRKIAAQETSLMPATLLNELREEEIADLVAFLKTLR